jgi:hypothetical protein
MADFILNLKGIVFLIMLAEFAKKLMISKQYSKYINFAISIFIIGVILSGIKGISFNLDSNYTYENPTEQTSENLIKKEYEKKIIEQISNLLAKNGINYLKVEVEIDDKYHVTKLIIHSNDKTEKVGGIIEGLGIKNYEVRHY